MNTFDDTGSGDLASRPTRFLLRVACVDRSDTLSSADRALYTAIGFFICFFGAYGSTAFLALLARAGAIHLGSLDAKTLLGVIASVLVATAFMMFDRSLVAYVGTDLDSTDRTADNLLRPVAPRNLKLFAGRLLVALLVSLFATQSLELVLFSSDIRHQRSAEELSQAKSELAAAREEQTTAQAAYTKKQTNLLDAAEKAARRAHLAWLGQHHHCDPNTQCSKRLRASDKAYREYDELGSGPLTAGSQYEKSVNQLAHRVAVLHDHPNGQHDVSTGPLQEVSALYAYVGRHRLALLYYAATVLILVAIDLAALLLKYFVAYNGEYDRHQAALRQVRWRETVDRLHGDMERNRVAIQEATEQERYDVEVRQSRAELARDAELAELKILKSGYAKTADSGEFAEAAQQAARAHIAGNLRKHSTEPTGSFAPAEGAGNADGGAGGSSAANAATSNGAGEPRADIGAPSSGTIAHTPLDRSLVLEVLGVTAGISALVYLLGGVYAYGQLKQASLSTSALAAVSTRMIVLHGVVIAAIGLPMVLGLSSAMEIVFVKLQRSSGVSDIRLSDLVTWLGLAWRYTWSRLRHLGRSPHEPTGRTVARQSEEESQGRALSLRSPQVVGGTVAAATMVGAGEITDSTAALIAGATSLGTAVIGLGFLALLGWVRPNSRGFRGALLLIAAAGTTLGAYWVSQRQPLALPNATAELINHKTCLHGPFLNQDATTLYMIDGRRHTLRLVPQRTIANTVVDSDAKPVSSTPISTVACRSP